MVFPDLPSVKKDRSIEPLVTAAELKKLLEEFKEAIAAAKTVDKLTMQPDCLDPEKAKLQERVKELEELLKKERNKVKKSRKK